METLFQLAGYFLQIYIICIIAWALISWLPMINPRLAYNDTVLAIRKFLDSIVLPWVRLFRGIPPVRMGATMLDLSALVAILVLAIGGPILLGLLAELAGV